jgi:N-acetylglucosamine kinase-like BadF-type ATPase
MSADARQGVLLGVDGGGTKTDVVVAALDGHPRCAVRVGCTNHETVGLAAAMSELERGVRDALTGAGAATGDVVVAAFGLAGLDWRSDEVAIGDALDGFGLGGERILVNDSMIALRAGSSRGWGIVSSIGTGAVTAGVARDGRTCRTMSVGWGEPCGASSIVADALHAIAAAHHRTGAPTALTDLLLQAHGAADVETLFEDLSRGRRRVDGRHAPLVQQAVDTGDQVAADVIDRSAVQHAAMVVGVADQLVMRDTVFELVTAGGVHTAGGRFAERFVAHVLDRCPQAVVVPLTAPPVTGAIGLALDLAHDLALDVEQDVEQDVTRRRRG